MPKLRKTAAPPKEEPKPEPKKTKAKVVKPKKYEDLPEIPDYERPELEKYEKSDFTATEFDRKTELPGKLEKQAVETPGKQPEQGVLKNGVEKVSFAYLIVFNLIYKIVWWVGK